MRFGRAEARIVGGSNDEPALHQFAQALHLLEMEDRKRWRAARHHAGGWMRPGDHRTAAVRCRSGRNDDDARDRDRLAVHASRAIEHAIGRSAERSAEHRRLADHGPRRACDLRRIGAVELALRLRRRRCRGSDAEHSKRAQADRHRPGDAQSGPMVWACCHGHEPPVTVRTRVSMCRSPEDRRAAGLRAEKFSKRPRS